MCIRDRIDIVDTDDLAAMNIDDLAIEQILAEEDEIPVALKGTQRGFGTELEGAAGRPANVFGGDNLQAFTSLQHQTGDTTRVCASADSNILETPTHPPSRAGDRRAENSGQGAQYKFFGHGSCLGMSVAVCFTRERVRGRERSRS